MALVFHGSWISCFCFLFHAQSCLRLTPMSSGPLMPAPPRHALPMPTSSLPLTCSSPCPLLLAHHALSHLGHPETRAAKPHLLPPSVTHCQVAPSTLLQAAPPPSSGVRRLFALLYFISTVLFTLQHITPFLAHRVSPTQRQAPQMQGVLRIWCAAICPGFGTVPCREEILITIFFFFKWADERVHCQLFRELLVRT